MLRNRIYLSHCHIMRSQKQANHLGGFRRIMPAVGNPEMYRTLIDHQDTTSVHKETISTTQKKQNAAALRRSINAKSVAPPQKPRTVSLDIPKNIFKSIDTGFLPSTIADWEEKERKMLMASRAFLVIIETMIGFVNSLQSLPTGNKFDHPLRMNKPLTLKFLISGRKLWNQVGYSSRFEAKQLPLRLKLKWNGAQLTIQICMFVVCWCN